MSQTTTCRRSFARLLLATGLSASVGVLAACGGSNGGSAPGADQAQGQPTSQRASGTLTVFAAASLNSVFTELGEEFEATHPGVDVAFNFGGSSGLVTQLTQGAPADVFASADQANMNKAVDAGLVQGSPTPFASNTLTIVTAPGNPENITSLPDLAARSRQDVQVVVCADPVPCGSATQEVEQAAGVQIQPVSEEQSVTDVLGKVTSGQADAGLVYVTDAKSAGDDVATVDFPEAQNAVNLYPIAVLESADDPATAEAFVDVVTGPQGQQALSAAGFAAP